jgi:hypothetical protein
MYPLLLTLHSLLRWLIVIFGVIAVIRGFAGWLGHKGWTATDDRLGMGFTISLDLQLLVGLVLYLFASPITTGALQNMGAAMGNSVLRFFTIEHVFGMVIAIIIAHVGRALARRAATDTGKHKRTALFFLLSLLIILISIPWPFLPAGAGRPWFRI